jgi:very-short-patch-repair endonuclease
MILEKETFEKFNYEVKSLTEQSSKKICLKCDYCNSIYETSIKNRNNSYKKLPKDACVKCKYIKREEIGNNPFSRPEVKEKIRQKNIEKYGVESFTQSEEFKKKSKQTHLEKYGTDNYSKTDQFKQQYKGVCLEKYGVENVSQLPEIRKRARQTTLERFGSEYFFTSDKCKQRVIDKYGVENVFQLESVKSKIIETNTEKYGYYNPMKNKDIANLAGKKSLETKIKKGQVITVDGKLISEISKDSKASKSHFYKLYNTVGLDAALNYTGRKTNIELIIEGILTRNNIEFQGKVRLENYIPDFVCGNVIIEANGNYFHSEKFADKYYHRDKRNKYIELGYKPLFFRSDEIENKPLIVESIIKNKLGLSERIYARKTQFKQITKQEGKQFLNENHLMGNGSGDCYALIYNNTIFSVIQIKNIKNGYKEISRFCIKNGFNIVGGFSKILKNLNLDRIKTFIDLRYGVGSYLTDLGFLESNCDVSFCWTDGTSIYHRMLFPVNSGYENGLLKVWDCGQKSFLKG